MATQGRAYEDGARYTVVLENKEEEEERIISARLHVKVYPAEKILY